MGDHPKKGSEGSRGRSVTADEVMKAGCFYFPPHNEHQLSLKDRDAGSEASPGLLQMLTTTEGIYLCTGGLRNSFSKDLNTTKFHFSLGLGQDTDEA